MSKNKQQVQLRRLQQTTIQFVGPLPPPEVLLQYDQALPGGAERIMALAERQSAHRQELEKTVVNSNCKNERLGTQLGFVLAMSALLGGFYLVAHGMNAAGIAAIIASLAAPAGAFIYGKRNQRQERAEKVRQFQQ